MSDQQTYLVTGAAGFIGSHLVDAFLKQGRRVIAVDNLLTGSQKNLEHALENPSCTFVHVDVTEYLDIPEPIHAIFHFASPASVVDYQKYPEETALVNSVGTRNLLLLAREKKARMLFASTSEVYGDPKVHPQMETYWGNVNPNGIRSCYDESKRYGEMMMMLYGRKYGVEGRIIRIFNTYGPRMRPTDGRVISNFVTQAIAGKPLAIYGDGLQTRSFCYVSDLVAGVIAVDESEKTQGEVINIGNPEEYSIIDLAKKIRHMTASASILEHHPLPQDDPRERRPDISKITMLTGWRPLVTVDSGLEKTIEYYQTLIKTSA